MKLKKCLFLPIAAVLLLFFAGEASAVMVRIDNAKVNETLAMGETVTGQVRVENTAEEPVTVRVYVEDWAYKSAGNGEKDFAPPGTMPRSASGWIKFNPTDFTIKPFAAEFVSYTIRAPESGLEGAYTSVLFFETSLGEQMNEQGAMVRVAARLGTLFFINIKGTENRRGEITEAAIQPPTDGGPMEIRTTFANTGNIVINLKGDFLIMDKDGLVQGRGEMEQIHTMPGASGASVTKWTGNLSPGTYDVVITLDLGEGELLVDEKKMTVD